jgi:beta-N-acetylhexosaminidase
MSHGVLPTIRLHRFAPLANLLLIVALLASCGTALQPTPSATLSTPATPTPQPTIEPTASPSPTAAPDPIEARIDAMSVEERIGQLLMPYAYGASATEVTAAQAAGNQQLYGVDTPGELVTRYHLGGVILLPRNTLHPTLADLPTGNTTDPAKVPALVDGLQRAALGDSGVPLLIATDQEEGLVTRIGTPLATFAGAMPLGATRDPDLARRIAAATGRELSSLGINLDLAPDADVNVEPRNPVIGLRSFGDDPTLVANLAAAQVEGYQQDAGIGAAAKHFPGHGDTTVDSHTGLPRITHDRATLDRLDLPPFASAIDAGVDVVMAGHLLVPALDPDQPATLSKPILTDLLRNQLGFDGVVMTDSLWMAGIRERSKTDADAALHALLAGADILLMPPDPASTVTALAAAVRDGSLSRERLDASVRRVLELKQRLGLLDAAWQPTAGMPAGSALAADRQLALDAATQAATLVSCATGALPLTGLTLVVGLAGPSRSLAAALPGADVLAVDFNPTAAQRQAALARAATANRVVLLTWDAGASAAQRQLLASLAAMSTPVIAVSVDLPYDLASTGQADARVATYGAGATSMAGLAAALSGNRFAGRLPVAVPGGFDFGAGMASCG